MPEELIKRDQERERLIRMRFTFIGVDECIYCKSKIEWWRTPKNKIIPLTACDLQHHRERCEYAFRLLKPGTCKRWVNRRWRRLI